MDIFDHALQVGIGILVTAGITAIGVWAKSVWMRAQAVTIAVKSLSHDALFRYCRYVMSKESITEAEHENLEHLYRAYSLLGMNGTGKKMYDECMKKPISTE